MPSPVPFRKVRKQLEDAGWYIASIRGSHHRFKHDKIAEQLSIPVHKNQVKAYYARQAEKAVAQAREEDKG